VSVCRGCVQLHWRGGLSFSRGLRRHGFRHGARNQRPRCLRGEKLFNLHGLLSATSSHNRSTIPQHSTPVFLSTCRTLRFVSLSAAPFLGHGFGIIPAPGSFAASAFSVPPCESFGPSQNAAARLGSSIHFALGCPKEMGPEMEKQIMYLYVKWNSFGVVCSPAS
jgi:hypothetical protein